MRTGSRWLHYLLADLYGMGVAPEIDRTALAHKAGEIRGFLEDNRIAKIHHATTSEILRIIKPLDYKLISVVRNPRDRIVSKAFHHKYQPKNKGDFDTDAEAVKHYVYSDYTKEANERQLEQMKNGYSTKNHTKNEIPYIWTTYEWMIDSIFEEVKAIDRFLGANTHHIKIRNTCLAHSFSAKSGREQGKENRKDTWRRKGIIGDWLNWFDVGMLSYTNEDQRIYWQKLLMNKGQDND